MPPLLDIIYCKSQVTPEHVSEVSAHNTPQIIYYSLPIWNRAKDLFWCALLAATLLLVEFLYRIMGIVFHHVFCY